MWEVRGTGRILSLDLSFEERKCDYSGLGKIFLVLLIDEIRSLSKGSRQRPGIGVESKVAGWLSPFQR